MYEAEEVNLLKIDVTVEEGVVYLSGETDDAQQKQVAERLAGTVPGVRRVINKVSVAP